MYFAQLDFFQVMNLKKMIILIMYANIILKYSQSIFHWLNYVFK